MKRWLKWAGIAVAVGAAAAVIGYNFILPNLWSPAPTREFSGLAASAERGEYMVRASGCVACHTDIKNKGKLFAGGPPLKTPFGTFYGPNITPDATAGIGGWTLEQFSNALTQGIAPDGSHYFPTFPYTNYTLLKSQDIADIKAYLDTVESVSETARNNEMIWPFSDRTLISGWKWLFFREGEFQPNPEKDDIWNRGAYLVRGPTHCGACHTERNAFGARKSVRLTGTNFGPNGHPVPGINRSKNHIEGWTKEDIVFGLQTGLKPDGDVMGGAMGEVIEEGTSHMSDDDLAAIAEYLLSLGKEKEQ